MRQLRLLLADDHNLVRAGIRALLTEIPGVSVIAETDNGEDAVALAKQWQPDVALLDITMPGMTGLQAAEEILAALPDTAILILSMHASDEYVTRALRIGVSGYLLKDSATFELQAALDAAVQGAIYLSPRIISQRADPHEGHAAYCGHGLTPRQLEVLRKLALGYSVKEIAYELNLSNKTVETYRAQIMERLDIHDLASLVRYAIRTGLISADS